jgi:hypothetical protein
VSKVCCAAALKKLGEEKNTPAHLQLMIESYIKFSYDDKDMISFTDRGQQDL